MIHIPSYAGKKGVILGLGKSGLSASIALSKSGASILTWDDSEQLRDAASQQGISILNRDKLDWTKIDFLLQSPGIPHTLPKPHFISLEAKKYNVPILCDVEVLLNARENANFIGITGTNGKSTTTALTTHILKFHGYNAESGGNIGVPALDLNPETETYVLELSSYQLELIHTSKLGSAVVLNLTPDHQDRHGSMEGYAIVKEKIFSLLHENGKAIVSLDDTYCRIIYENIKLGNHEVIPISGSEKVQGGIYVDQGHLIDDYDFDQKQIADLVNLPTLKGAHNYQNIAAAYSLLVNNYSIPHFQKALEMYPGLAHRQEVVGHVKDITIINDSKATNMDSTTKSLAAFNNMYWILGGLMKEGGDDIIPIRPYFPKIRKAYTIGSSAKIYYDLLKNHMVTIQLETLDQAVQMAMNDALNSFGPCTVLLSPACASWDQFKSFEHRGDEFKILVQNWIHSHGA